ncbi:SWI/SNF complex component SNF12 homolog [Trifolium pratense]|nr:SWI/SNF complex component SNF12 homolog [Trifolium pratense]XP_045792571.1 SWI/SNF complex component SNF12 homolog [Trifolium pratense]
MNNNNNPPKIPATAQPSFLGSSSIAVNPPQPIHLLTQSHPQTQGSSSTFPGHFQLSQPQPHVIAQQQPQFPNPRSHPQTQLQQQQQKQQQSVSQMHINNNTNVASPATAATTTTAAATTTTSAKRAHQKSSSRPQGSPSGNQTSAFKTMELTPAPLRKKRNLQENLIPEKVAKLVPESAIYTRLLELEAQIDAVLNRKKIDVQEAVKNPHSVRKTLRVYVYNTFSNQTKLDSGKVGGVEEPSWSLRLTGRILEEVGKDSVVGGVSKKESLYPKFSAFFKKITVYLDQGFYPDNHVMVWDSARSSVQQDGFEVKRKGDKEFTAVIRLTMNYSPEKFMVSTPLAKVLGIEFDTRPRIMAALWNYVKFRKLQSPNDPSFFMCDASLQKVFGEEKMKFSLASQKISQHLSQPQPIHLEHKIKLSGNCPAGTACYDVQVDVPLPLQKDMSAFLTSMESHKEIDAFDEVICTSVKKIHEHLRRRAFLLGFSQSPAEFINALIVSQGKDLKLVAGDASHNAEKEQRSEFYNQPWVEDAVIRYLNRKSARTDAP